METNTTTETSSALALPIVPRTWDRRVAKAVSNGGNPVIMALASTCVIAATLASPAAWRWMAFEIFFSMMVPVSYIFWLVRRKRVTDFDIYHREQRHSAYLVTIGCVLTTILVMWIGNAPLLMLFMALAAFAQATLMFLINLRWKISSHAAGMAGFVTLLSFLLGGMAALSLLGIPLMIWSRVRLRRHTLMQTVAGSLLGVVIFGIFMWLGLRAIY